MTNDSFVFWYSWLGGAGLHYSLMKGGGRFFPSLQFFRDLETRGRDDPTSFPDVRELSTIVLEMSTANLGAIVRQGAAGSVGASLFPAAAIVLFTRSGPPRPCRGGGGRARFL